MWIPSLLIVQFLFFAFLYSFAPSTTSFPVMYDPLALNNDHVRIDMLERELASTRAQLKELDVINHTAPIKIHWPVSGRAYEEYHTTTTEAVPDGGWQGRAAFFSVVLAAYNQGQYIEETMRSLLGQRYPHWEAIIVDDGSTDNTWDLAKGIMSANLDRRIRVVRKHNGGLADARNIGLGYARGNWLCMLDSDDLLGEDYMLRAAEIFSEAPTTDIVPGCMRNFDAVSSDWCFPEGWSVTGVAHWNKFHASVLMNRRLMEAVGGYDPGIPWGLEDWNFWLHTAVHNPVVRFVPEVTFFYRHHKGTSMRKKMMSMYLEETKAIVRTNHADLYEPMQLHRDHATIAAMRPETVAELDKKMAQYPSLPKPYFWRGLRMQGEGRLQEAVRDFTEALRYVGQTPHVLAEGAWQIHFRLGLAYEALGDLASALPAVNEAFKGSGAYYDDLLAAKYRIEQSLRGAAGGVGTAPGRVAVVPSYWGNEAEERNIRRATLAGKLGTLAQLEDSLGDVIKGQAGMLALLKSVSHRASCPPRGTTASPNLVHNPFFEEGSAGWGTYGKGFTVDKPPAAREGARSRAALRLENSEDGEGSGAMQVVQVGQSQPAPVVVKAWSRGEEVSGRQNSGYSLYMDINFADGTHQWAYSLPFDPGTHGWQLKTAYLDFGKAIASLDVYCMLREHTGVAWFDDVVVADSLKAACACKPGELFAPSPERDCDACHKGKVCVFGDRFQEVAE